MALLITLIIMIMIPNPTRAAPNFLAQYCSNSSTYAAANSSSFATNLNTLLSFFSSNAATNPTGFNTTSVVRSSGTDGGTVYGLFLCRGDQNTSGCSDCVATAAREQPKRITCPRTKRGVLWYDECMVRYDSEPIAGTMDQTVNVSMFSNQNIQGDQKTFANLLEVTMNELAVRAANSPDQTGKKYANENVGFSSSQHLNSMVQCTPDLSASDCNRCLSTAIGQLVVRQGGRVLQPSCNVRYAVYPFLDIAFNWSSTANSVIRTGGVNGVPSSSLLDTVSNSSSPQPTTSSSTTGTDHDGEKKVPLGVSIAIVVVIVLGVGSCIIIKKLRKRKLAKKNDVVSDLETGDDINMVESLLYDLSTLEAATDNFSNENKLGEGGFGGVYKGRLRDGQEIAVKKLSKTSSQGIHEFKNEVLVVAKLQHRNLVRLLGFCLAKEEKLLVYEYVPNKSLDYFLFDPEKRAQLEWRNRYNIIQGIARGMLYLHQDSRLKIIHRDLKASNILLDENMNPKISDFGLARIFDADQVQDDTNRIVGTYGYMAPEYAMHGEISVKSDVYSFGVLILEIVSGEKNSKFYRTSYADDLLSYGWKYWKDNMPLSFVDPIIRDSCLANEVMRCLHLGLSCVQESVDARPTMATIVLALDSHAVALPVPAQPTSYSKIWTQSRFANGVSSDHQLSTESSSRLWSVNDVTISEFYPR